MARANRHYIPSEKGSDLFPDLIFKSGLIRRRKGQIHFSKGGGIWGQPLVQPLKLHILQVRVLPQELPIYLGSYIRLTRR